MAPGRLSALPYPPFGSEAGLKILSGLQIVWGPRVTTKSDQERSWRPPSRSHALPTRELSGEHLVIYFKCLLIVDTSERARLRARLFFRRFKRKKQSSWFLDPLMIPWEEFGFPHV